MNIHLICTIANLSVQFLQDFVQLVSLLYDRIGIPPPSLTLLKHHTTSPDTILKFTKRQAPEDLQQRGRHGT